MVKNIFFDKELKKLPKISSFKAINWNKLDLVFLSLPNGGAQKMIKTKFSKYKHLKFIDLSADFRLANYKHYAKTYKLNHKAKSLIKYSIYSIGEFKKKKIKNFRIISNPGCYPTSIQLPLIPLIKKDLIKLNNITIDSKSDIQVLEKSETKFKHKNLYNSIHAYSIKNHRHISEIDQEFLKITKKKISYTFNPHLLPTFRGILSTIYLDVNHKSSIKKIKDELTNFYKRSSFVKILKLNTEIGTGNVINTNNCEISVCETRLKKRIIIFSAIDNLVKGASGQAIENMNLLYGFSETEGLK